MHSNTALSSSVISCTAIISFQNLVPVTQTALFAYTWEHDSTERKEIFMREAYRPLKLTYLMTTKEREDVDEKC